MWFYSPCLAATRGGYACCDCGGPFYDTNRDFSQALEDRIFDAEAKGCVLKVRNPSQLFCGIAVRC
eukprot:3940949-Rhodomonas_salina.1